MGGCGIIGIMNERGLDISGEWVMSAIASMHERGNGLGGGFAAYGIYPEYRDYYAFHLMFDHPQAKEETETFLKARCLMEQGEPIPTRPNRNITNPPLLWRYFLRPKEQYINGPGEADFMVSLVMDINAKIAGSFVASSGKNMGGFKGVSYPADIGNFFRLDEYKGYIWTAHGRFPTNSQGWWGGAHPFGLLDWTVVHNGEISSYGINKRYLENFGYRCTLFTDTEVMAYLFDLLIRKHQLPLELAAKVLSAPFWDEIGRMEEKQRKFFTALRIVYGSALVNGPFAVVVGSTNGMVGLNDRIKLRPLIAARDGDMLYIASEDSAIREICSHPEKVWMPRAGEPVVGILKSSIQEDVSKWERESLLHRQWFGQSYQ
ncbi:MAG: glutamine amidotransferase family protein [Thermodesulfobacteriota bacterium]